jgi:hypothetical protein
MGRFSASLSISYNVPKGHVPPKTRLLRRVACSTGKFLLEIETCKSLLTEKMLLAILSSLLDPRPTREKGITFKQWFSTSILSRETHLLLRFSNLKGCLSVFDGASRGLRALHRSDLPDSGAPFQGVWQFEVECCGVNSKTSPRPFW